MTTTKLADDSVSIAQRLKEIEAEKLQRVMGKPLVEEPKPEVVEVGWPYGVYTSGYQDALNLSAADLAGCTATFPATDDWTFHTQKINGFTVTCWVKLDNGERLASNVTVKCANG